MKKFRILLLNCTSKDEPNESDFLGEFFKMVQLRYPKSVQYKKIEITSERKFKVALSENWANVIHISAHGCSKKYSSGRRGKSTSIFIGSKEITSEQISKYNPLNAELVFISACQNSYRDMAGTFLDKLGVKYYLAPKTKIDWTQAAIFAIIFYERYLYDRVKFESAYNFAKENTKSGKDFPEYWIPQ